MGAVGRGWYDGSSRGMPFLKWQVPVLLIAASVLLYTSRAAEQTGENIPMLCIYTTELGERAMQISDRNREEFVDCSGYVRH